MNANDLCHAPVTKLCQWLATGEITALELTEAYLARIQAHDDRLHAYVNVYADDARAAANAADLARQAGHVASALHGIPVAIKDIIDIQGRITTGGSAVWLERRSEVTATLVSRMLAAGMIILGKTHSVEFAMGSWGTNQHMGSPRNPWDNKRHRAPGGSSAGSAVSVAAGMAPWAIGTDTGGSVRIPSAFCGLTGLKTTLGRVSCFGVLPLSTSLDTPGPMCRSAADAATLFDVIQGSDPLDRNTLGVPVYDAGGVQLSRGAAPLAGVVLARLPEEERAGVDQQILSALDAAADHLANLGATIIEAKLPVSFAELGTEVGRIIGAEGYVFVGDLTENAALPIDDDVRPRIRIGRDMSASEYIQLCQRRVRVNASIESALAGVDGLLTPTASTAAPAVDEIDQSGTAAGFTRPINHMGGCALALPMGTSSDGLPLSMQIACPAYEENTALKVGLAYQEQTQWHCQTPPELT